MQDAGLESSKVRAIFISHEHSDHVHGVRVLSKRLGVPAWFTQGTFDSLRFGEEPERVNIFTPDQVIKVGTLNVHTFLKNHDAAEPCSFRIEFDGWNIGVFTDIGEPCQRVINHLHMCHAIFIETNYDEKMLWNGIYPYHLKNRVASSVGHLSNDQAFALVRDHAGPELVHVFLSHLSGENNRPEIAAECFKTLTDRFTVHLTSRYAVGPTCRMR